MKIYREYRTASTALGFRREYPITDHLGSIRVVLTPDERQSIVSRSDFEPFGAPLSNGRERLSFIGKEQDNESSLGDYGVRKYDPSLGRFMSVDALSDLMPGTSPFHYCFNNPLILRDPSGLVPGVSSTADINDALTNFEFGSDEASPLKPGDPLSDAEKLRDATASQMAQEWQKGRGAARMGEPTAADRVGMAWEKLVKTTGQVADYTIMLPIDFAGAAYDLGRNYYDMRDANFKLSDKYFHAKANFQATHRGPGGQYFAEHFSNLREIWDQNIKGDPRLASELDQKANLYGRTQAKYFGASDYREALKIYRPALLPMKY